MLKKLIVSINFLLFFFVLGLISCSKSSDNIEEAKLEIIPENDFSESDEDLTNVDYKEFYDELSPHGEWIEVKDKDIGIELQQTSDKNTDKSISFSDFFGVKEAHADDVSFGAFFVWKPSPNLAVGVAAGEPVVYRPYYNGQWLHSDAGWYFKAASEPEEITHHYGRWVYSPSLGWVWLPGRVWAPAWVEWREENEYIAWSPIPPRSYIVNNVVIIPPVYEETYVVVEKRYFPAPVIYQHVYTGHNFKVKHWKKCQSVMVVNNYVTNYGPDITLIESYYGNPVSKVSLQFVKSKSDVKYTHNEINIVKREFKKYKPEYKNKTTSRKPPKYENFSKVKKDDNIEKYNEHKNNKSKDEQDYSDKNNSKVKPKLELGDDRDMKNGKRDKNNNENLRNEKQDRNDVKKEKKNNKSQQEDIKQKDKQNNKSRENENRDKKDSRKDNNNNENHKKNSKRK